jgi:hypothetical protein
MYTRIYSTPFLLFVYVLLTFDQVGNGFWEIIPDPGFLGNKVNFFVDYTCLPFSYSLEKHLTCLRNYYYEDSKFFYFLFWPVSGSEQELNPDPGPNFGIWNKSFRIKTLPTVLQCTVYIQRVVKHVTALIIEYQYLYPPYCEYLINITVIRSIPRWTKPYVTTQHQKRRSPKSWRSHVFFAHTH